MPAKRLPKSNDWRYGIILDAGSSGTRLHIYRWLDNAIARKKGNSKSLQSLPAIETKKKWTKKIHPGISTFAENPARVGPDHLEHLFDNARKHIPEDAVKDTPLFFLATAGMRLLPENQRNALLDEVCRYASLATNFQLPDCDLHIRVIPGEVEGLYGWLAANYLLGSFHAPEGHAHGRDHDTYGFLDLGGASAQVAFAPNATEAERHANDLKLLRLRTVDGIPAEYRVFSMTWLGFGVNEAKKRYVEALKHGGPAATGALDDPCLPSGLDMTTKGDFLLPGSKETNGKKTYFHGTGKFDECLIKTYPLLEKDHACKADPCLLSGVHVPAIDFDVNHFVGVSEYWHTTHEIFEMGEKDKAYDFNTYQNRVKKFCSQKWDDIREGIEREEWGSKVDEKTAEEVCFKASWLINILHDGIGIPRVGLEETPDAKHNGTKKLLDSAKEQGHIASFQAINKIDNTEVSWTLGKMILYASSQIPSVEISALPVGFGSNTPGIPADFQYPSIESTTITSSYPKTNTSIPPNSDTWQTSILHPTTPRRIPGILLFLGILCLAIYILRFRSRKNLNSRNPSPPRTKRTPFLSVPSLPNIFRSSPQGTYTSLREGGSPNAYDDVELATVEEDSSDSSIGSKASGWATPRSLSSGNLAPGVGVFESLGPGHGLGIGMPNAMGRSGLVGRTESRERIVGMGGEARSRRASPSRGGARLGKLIED